MPTPPVGVGDMVSPPSPSPELLFLLAPPGPSPATIKGLFFGDGCSRIQVGMGEESQGFGVRNARHVITPGCREQGPREG